MVHSIPIWLPQTQTWLYGQVKHLPESIQSHIVCDRVENLDQFHLPNIHCLLDESTWRYYWEKGTRKLRLRRHLPFLVEHAARCQAQVLHSHFGNIGWLNLSVAKRARVKHVVTFYGLDLSYLPRQDPRWHHRYAALFSQVDRILCEGPFMARSIVNLGCPAYKIRVHHLGINTDEIAWIPRKWNPLEPLRVLIAATFREKKGIPLALEALGRLQHEVPLAITIIGDAGNNARDQAEKQQILQIIERHNLLPKLRMLGYQPHSVLFEEAYQHHVFLSPSITSSDGDTEGGAPVTIIEMAATGMPVVSTVHCDIPEVIDHRRTGLLAKERDIDGLVVQLKWLLDHPDQWQAMTAAARHHVDVEFNARVQGARLATIYQGMVA
ncbi:putative colanic acid biosynthesis glycosyl transferase [Nitrolancea hollandica Lb]|uniref:Putative colanic acid biosynthesis glycosyl transferase n=1 Tax=Nitrolancea hollandica Lb TaxID=1129897 RepID=I4EHZ5_9BACT|nr:putative colanic acid biosynthesis glycosyl transferase [Nitrolancea hollandica Lb]